MSGTYRGITIAALALVALGGCTNFATRAKNISSSASSGYARLLVLR
jgi:hypothetical protein